jgi:Zn-dependent metalloprotease
MKKPILVLALGLFSMALSGQYLNQIATETSSGWYRFKNDINITSSLFLEGASSKLGLGSNNSLKIVKTETDQIGFMHTRLQQTYKGIDVEAADFILHENGGRLISMNGKLVKGLNLNVTPSISNQTAIIKALDFVNAKSYMWQKRQNEEVLKDLLNDSDASYYPTPELVIAQKDFNQNGADYRLMYKIDIYATQPLSRQDVYVDAKTGEVVFTLDKIHTGDVPGIAHTKYSGVQNIITDSVAPGHYRLRESTTGGGIETYNMLRTRDYSQAVDFTDSNNIWDNFNSFQDEVATDAHWGAQTTYTYFLNKHGRDSYDGKGTKLLNYVHYDFNYANAFWDGQRMTYGDGNGSSYHALISLDIAAHEMTHGVTQNSAGLIYRNEWGALNESFSDIFAQTTEYFGTPQDFNYRIGEKMTVDSLGIRSMSDPKSMGDPDTYLAGLWYTGPLDNGGVHINSGVQNYWFYVLTEGDSGQNDLGVVYDINGIGIEKAAAISYRNLAYYLTRTSEYYDARAGAIQAAEDLYGVCSLELLTVVEAWRAVGVGDFLRDEDMILVDVINPITSCGLGSSEAITLLSRYYDCNDTLTAGSIINAGYQLDNLPAVSQQFTLGQDLYPGDTLLLTFNQTVDLSAFRTYSLKSWINYASDMDNSNDTIFETIIANSLQQNSDFAIEDMTSPNSQCSLSNTESIEVDFSFLGCDSLVAGQSIDITYQIDNQNPVTETMIVGTTLYPEDEISYTFSNPVDLSAKGVYDFSLWVDYSGDTDHSNDSIVHRLIQNPFKVKDHYYGFENREYTMDSLYFFSTSDSKVIFSADAAETDTLGISLTGSNPFENIEDFLIFRRRQPWNINPSFSSKACACVDARDWDSVRVSFDLKQTFSRKWLTVLGYVEKGVSSFRVTVDGQQLGETLQPNTNKNDRFRLQEYNLKDYAHTQFELCLEARNYLAPEYDDMPNSEGDQALVDNLRIFNNGNIHLKEYTNPDLKFDVFPNPTSGSLVLKIELVSPLKGSLEILNTNGKVLRQNDLKLPRGEHTLNIEMGNLPKGMYLLKIDNKIKQVFLQ